MKDLTQSAAKRQFEIKVNDSVSFQPGRIGSGEQVIIGVPDAFLLAVFFNANGEMLRHEVRTVLPAKTTRKTDRKFRRTELTKLWKILDEWKAELLFTPTPIQVHQFFISELGDLGIGIRELPHFLEQFVSEPPGEIDEIDQLECEDEITEWRTSNRFVLRWGNEYWMNCRGEVTNT